MWPVGRVLSGLGWGVESQRSNCRCTSLWSESSDRSSRICIEGFDKGLVLKNQSIMLGPLCL